MNSPEKWKKWFSLAQKKWQEMKAPPNPKINNNKCDFKKDSGHDKLQPLFECL